uniref:Uncharacterized protein n=1 Tax=Anguilla anguilla TaxID=7936 RepID=A0A0E9WJ71_ANGAN
MLSELPVLESSTLCPSEGKCFSSMLLNLKNCYCSVHEWWSVVHT